MEDTALHIVIDCAPYAVPSGDYCSDFLLNLVGKTDETAELVLLLQGARPDMPMVAEYVYPPDMPHELARGAHFYTRRRTGGLPT